MSAALVDFQGAETEKIGTIEVSMNARDVLFSYDVLTWRLPLGNSDAMRLMRDVVVLKHVRHAMSTHPDFDEIVVRLRRSDG